MAIISVMIGGRSYQLACDDGQEEQLRFLAEEVDDRVRDLHYRLGANPGEVMGLLLSAVTMADELIDNKKEISRLSGEVRQLLAIVDNQQQHGDQQRISEIEDAMAITLDEIASRIEKIAQNLEIR
jgi:cell division protein ZapA